MNKTTKEFMSTKQLVLASVMTSLVLILQSIANNTAIFGSFSSAVGLIPIILGACLCGPVIGAWLGLVFSIMTFFSASVAIYLAYNPYVTVIIILVKGTVAGYVTALVYKALNKVNGILAAVVASIACPTTNTAIFLLGCLVFFYRDIDSDTGFGAFCLTILVCYAIELAMCIALSPTIIKLINIRKKQTK